MKGQLEQNDTRGVIMNKITHECQSEESYGGSVIKKNYRNHTKRKFSSAELV